MRVTEGTNFGVIRDSITRSKGRMENLQLQSATLKKVNAPSDDPSSAARLLEIRTDKVNNDQFSMNAKIARTYLDNTDQALGELSDIALRAKEIAINQSSGASSNDQTRIAVAEEVTQLFQQAVATANKRVGERYLFGGFKTSKPPIDETGRYQGDDGQIMHEISRDVFLSSNVTGLDAFNTKPRSASEPKATVRNPNQLDGAMAPQGRGPASLTTEGMPAEAGGELPENVNLFDELQSLRIGLLTGDIDAVRGTLERFDDLHGKLVSTRAKVGSRVQGLESATLANEKHDLTNAQLKSVLEDADMAQVVSDLAKEETIYRSALQSSQKLIQPTLLDFLK